MTHHGSGVLSTGQVLVFAALRAGSATTDVFDAQEVVKNNMQKHGQLFAFVCASTFPDGSFRAVAEFCNASAAFAAVTTVTNSPIVEVRDILSPSV